MKYTVEFSESFAKEFTRVPQEHQDAVLDFVVIYQGHGLNDQTKYPGRVSPSWHNLPVNHPNYAYTKQQHLWHYHVGLPDYAGAQLWGKTSDWVLHFQWPDRGPTVALVDLYQHYTWDNKFYLPPKSALSEEFGD